MGTNIKVNKMQPKGIDVDDLKLLKKKKKLSNWQEKIEEAAKRHR